MISFINDYSEGAHPHVLELMLKSNLEQNNGYGNDNHSNRAKEYIKKELGCEDVDIHFIPGGTQTNLLVISAFLRPHQCVIAADTGHVNVHETGAIEATGHKVVTVPHQEGKLTPDGIRKVLSYHSGEHMVQPKMVYLSDTTELGTIYTKAELTAIRQLCNQEGLLLFLDGARLGSALTCRRNDLTLKDIADLVDVFYIGGTKNGALLGEALVICREDLKEDFRFLIKQRGAMTAKGFVIGMQFEALFENGLYYDLGAHANRMAEQLTQALLEKGYSFYAPSCSNQLFPILPDETIQSLSKEFGFLIQERVDDKHSAIRLVTSWATTQSNVDVLIKYIQER
ncbi:MAG: aromatic amino acid beta-eliminating lyase/threonine aldolase [Herbinix sp.]|jgi:threonine aldolase|nr:aromatic amino acid beta-eliminating lyase/threonine aldolase [Herbinix sp.]